ncbi:hypothetical protein AAMO2058_001563600 [Amorphochlora amoebiformis]
MCYLVLELLQGGDLLERVADDHSFSDSDAADVIRTVAGVLDYLHEMGIIHRDLKPQNLVYRSDAKGAQLVVTDFGLSKFLKDGATHTKTACGTPLYLAPEVIMGNGYGKECDLWSLGVMLYVLLTGYYPFYSSDRRRLYSKITRCAFKWPDNGNFVDERAKDLVSKLLVVDLKERYTAKKVLEHPWLVLPRTIGAVESTNRAKNIRRMRAREIFRKTVDHLIDINRFLSVFALLPDDVQQRCSGRTYRRRNPALTSKLGHALSRMAVALVDRKKHYSLVYKMKGGGYWLVATSTEKQEMLKYAKKYFTKDDEYFVFSGPEPGKHRFLGSDEFSELADHDEELSKASPIQLPAEHLDVDDDIETIPPDSKRPSVYQADHSNASNMIKNLTEVEANAIVKVTTKLIASKLFSPRKGRMVRFDFAKALEGADTKEEQKRPKKTKPILIMTPRTIAALQEQVKTAEARLESAKQELETARRNQKKNAIRELRIATEALAIAKSLLAEAQAQEQVSDSKENSNPQQPKKAPSNCTDSVNNRLEEEPVDA